LFTLLLIYALFIVVPCLAIVEYPSVMTDSEGATEDHQSHDVKCGLRPHDSEAQELFKPISLCTRDQHIEQPPRMSSVRRTLRHLCNREDLSSASRGFCAAIIYDVFAFFKPIFIRTRDQQPARTSSIRRILRHLYNRAGLLSASSGVFAAILYDIFAWDIVSGAIIPLEGYRLNFVQLTCLKAVLACVISVLLSPICLWCYWLIISENSYEKHMRSKMFLRALSQFRKIALPTLVCAAIDHLRSTPSRLPIVTSSLAQYLEALLGSDPQFRPIIPIIVNYSSYSLEWLLFFGIGLPNKVVLLRVYASLLPGDLTTVVPCDRSFGGKVVPGGEERLGMLDALRTFDRASWIRIYKLYDEICGIWIAHAIIGHVINFVEIWLVSTEQRSWVPNAGRTPIAGFVAQATNVTHSSL